VGRVVVLAAGVDKATIPGDDHRLAAQLEDIRTPPGGLSIGLGEFLVVDVVPVDQLGILLLAPDETDLRICKWREVNRKQRGVKRRRGSWFSGQSITKV